MSDCQRGHALIRIWSDGAWWLGCCNPGCMHRIFESYPTHPQEGTPMTNYVTLREDIWAAPPEKLPELLAKAGYVKVEIDEDLHEGREPDGESQTVGWQHLDTAYRLLRIASVRTTLIHLREVLAEQGMTYPTDEELFAKTAEGGVASYIDLAHDTREARNHVYEAFAGLTEAAHESLIGQFNEQIREAQR